MKTLILSAAAAAVLLLGSPAQAQYAPAQSAIGGALAGAATGAAIGAIAGGGRGAATGALIGGTVGGALSGPAYAGPHYRRYTTYRRCGLGWHWVVGHHNRWGEWRPGHCSPNY